MTDTSVRNGESQMNDYRVVLKVKEIINDRGMTQKELSELTGLRPNTVSMLVRGYVERLSLSHVQRIANFLDITDIREIIDLLPEEEAREYDYKY